MYHALPAGLWSALAAVVAVGAPAAQEQPAVDVTNGLAVDLLHALGRERPDANLFFSPFSLAEALTMVTEGARDETAAEMAKVLHFPAARGGAAGEERPIAAVHAAFAALRQRLEAGSGASSQETRARIEKLRQEFEAGERRSTRLAEEINGLLATVDRYELHLGNALWVASSLPLAPDFVTTLDRSYGSGAARSLDFATDREAARRQINGWIGERTGQRIPQALAPGAVRADTGILLTSVVWFAGQWEHPFDTAWTRAREFTLANGERVQATLMHDDRGPLPYAAFTGDGRVFRTPELPPGEGETAAAYPDDDGFTMIELPYKGGGLAMLVLRPRTPSGLARLEARLDVAALSAWVAALQCRKVDTALLRFRLDDSRELSRPLASLGMGRAFRDPGQPDGAQFGGLCASADPQQQVRLGDVFHSSRVAVAETGTEAVAVSVLSGPVTGTVFTPVFHTDHPFLFAIRDTKSGAILFLGRVLDPRR